MSRKWFCEWGMSSLGPLTFGKKEEQIFLGANFHSTVISAKRPRARLIPKSAAW